MGNPADLLPPNRAMLGRGSLWTMIPKPVRIGYNASSFSRHYFGRIGWGSNSMRRLVIGFFACLLLSPCVARADILYYDVGGLEFRFEGKAKVDSGRTVMFRHPRFGTFYFGYDDVKFYKAPSTLSICKRKLGKAKDDPKACIEAARWALHHGLLDDFYKAASMAWHLDKNDPTVQRLARLKRKMNAPVPIYKEQEEEMIKYLPGHKNMEFIRSDHFLLMHNTDGDYAKETSSSKKRGKKSKTVVADERLELLEKVYESFLLKFYLEGLEVELPKKRLKVVLFADRSDFLAYCESTDAGRASAAGLYDKRSNIAVFYNQGTHEGFKGLDRAKKQLAELADEAKRVRSPSTAQLVRMAKSFDLLSKVAKLNQDIEVVSHECTHQMAANTGLQPNESAVPVWVAEGIATYFESPKEAAWAGIGTVNESRLSLYRQNAGDTARSNVEYIVSDDVFMKARSHEEVLNAYSQAWALNHFLMAHHFDKLMKYYQLLAKRKAKVGKMFPPEKNIAAFKKIFGDDLKTLNAQWRRYMRDLKTDVERVVDGE